MSACSLSSPDCAQCGATTTPSILPTDEGPMTISLLCAPCHEKAWRDFTWIKGWALRFERWGLPRWVIGVWWIFWTEREK